MAGHVIVFPAWHCAADPFSYSCIAYTPSILPRVLIFLPLYNLTQSQDAGGGALGKYLLRYSLSHNHALAAWEGEKTWVSDWTVATRGGPAGSRVRAGSERLSNGRHFIVVLNVLAIAAVTFAKLT